MKNLLKTVCLIPAMFIWFSLPEKWRMRIAEEALKW
jgi:hypothetical protein